MRKLRHEEIPRPTPAELAVLPRLPLVLLAHNIRSIHNVGSFFRTSDAVRLGHVYLTGYSGTPGHRGVHKTALGAQDLVPWTHAADPHLLLDQLQADGYHLAALEITDTPTPLTAIQPGHFPLCLMVGNEVEGLADDLLARADCALEIPQYGAKQSLNVAVAYGIAIYALAEKARALR